MHDIVPYLSSIGSICALGGSGGIRGRWGHLEHIVARRPRRKGITKQAKDWVSDAELDTLLARPAACYMQVTGYQSWGHI
jgi:hypothetical protein